VMSCNGFQALPYAPSDCSTATCVRSAYPQWIRSAKGNASNAHVRSFVENKLLICHVWVVRCIPWASNGGDLCSRSFLLSSIGRGTPAATARRNVRGETPKMYAGRGQGRGHIGDRAGTHRM
jgi:hypothetical protein